MAVGVGEDRRAAQPVDFLRATTPYDPHDGQEEIHNAVVRHRLASCGRRFGKSTLGGHELWLPLLEAYKHRDWLTQIGDRAYYWIVGPNYDDTEREWRVFYDLCKSQGIPFDKPGTYNDVVGGNMQMSCWGGRFIVQCRSAAHPESLDGEGLSGVLMVEAAKMKPLIWTKFILPALSDKHGWSLHTSTPEGRNHFYELWQRGQDPNDDEWMSWRKPSWDNIRRFPGGIGDDEIESLRNNMSTERFNQEIAADFTDFVGRVFKEFDEEVHVRDFEYDARNSLFGAVDYGWTNPFVWLDIQVDVWENVYVLDEYYTTQTDINDIARYLIGTGRSNASAFFPDPASPGDSAVLGKHLRVPFSHNTGGELKHRLELIRQGLKRVPSHLADDHPEKQPKLFINRRCVNLIHEMNEYRFPERKNEQRAAPEEPMSKDDHGPEALGRFYLGYFGPLSGQGGAARVSKANVTGRGGRGYSRARIAHSPGKVIASKGTRR